MARTAGQVPRRLFAFDFGALVRAAMPPRHVGAGAAASDDLTTRAVACAGLAALFGLPILMLASVVLSAPLAAPAAIALGYLAMSYALASEHPRSAATINAVVLIGLIVWSLGFLLAVEGPSRAGLVAALLAPAFAAAPALARFAMATGIDPATGAAERSAACLDRLAPNEAVLLVRRDGALLAATRAAGASLRLTAGAAGDVGRAFQLVDRPKLSDAMTRCAPDAPPLALTLRDEERTYGAEISAAEADTVSIRLTPFAAAELGSNVVVPAVKPEEISSKDRDAAPSADVGEAVGFAMRHAEPDAEARGVLLTTAAEEGIAVACERQALRRILHLMIESAMMRARPGDALHLTARALKGVALLRVDHSAASDNAPQAASTEGTHVIALRALADEAGGTLVVGDGSVGTRLSVRLALAALPMKCMKQVDSAGFR